MSSCSKLDGGIEISFHDDRHYRHITLPNKLTVLLVQDETADTAAASMNVSAGHFLNPEYAPGLAHFLEHMLFMGTEKYPNENDYDTYLTSHGGSNNAYTSEENTNFYFDISHDYLEGALDRFAQFFISPLFAEGSTFREMLAVDSENSKNLQSDTWRLQQLFRSFARKDHPMSKFSTGNLHTLSDMPKATGKDIREELLAFYDAHYSANLMGLVVVGRESLDQLQAWVEAKFSDIPNKDRAAPSFPRDPFPPSSLGVEVHVVPIKEQRTVSLMWPVPSEYDLYRTAPSDYVAHLMEQQGPGSIISLLRARGWAHELSASALSGSSWGKFEVEIGVTQQGFAALHEVVGVVYEYIAMLQREGPQAWIWGERKAQFETNFLYRSMESPVDCAVNISPDLLRIPAKHVASFDQLLYEFDAAAITDFLNRLKPEAAILTVLSPSFAQEERLQQEEWYKTEYSVRPVSATALQQWSAPTISPELKLPLPNELISTDFSLRPHTGPGAEPSREQTDVGGGAYAPVVLKDTPLTRLWFKQDLWYKKPQLSVDIKLDSPVMSESIEASLYSGIFINLVNGWAVGGYSYMAEKAGMSFALSSSVQGLVISFYGYSQNMPLLVQKVVGSLGKFQLHACHELDFVRTVDHLRRTFQRQQKSRPLSQAATSFALATQLPGWTNLETLEAMEHVSMKGLRAILPRLLRQVHLEVLMYGNVNSEDALQLMETIERELGSSPLLPEQRRAGVVRRVALAPGTTYVRAVAGADHDEPNSALQVMFQIGDCDDLESGAALCIMSQIAQEAAFKQLRTVEQLGYIVAAGMTLSLDLTTSFFYLGVQSSRADPVHLDSRVENFLRLFRSQLVALSDEAFQLYQKAAIAKNAEKDTSIPQERERHWSEITTGHYSFDGVMEETAALAKVTRESLLAFFDLYIGAGGERRTKFSSQVFSAAHGEPAPPISVCATPFPRPPQESDNDSKAKRSMVNKSLISRPSLLGRHATASKGADVEKSAAATTSAKTVGGDEETEADLLSPAEIVAAASSRVVYVDDVRAFKRSMPLYPVQPVVDPPASLLRCQQQAPSAKDSKGTRRFSWKAVRNWWRKIRVRRRRM